LEARSAEAHHGNARFPDQCKRLGNPPFLPLIARHQHCRLHILYGLQRAGLFTPEKISVLRPQTVCCPQGSTKLYLVFVALLIS